MFCSTERERRCIAKREGVGLHFSHLVSNRAPVCQKYCMNCETSRAWIEAMIVDINKENDNLRKELGQTGEANKRIKGQTQSLRNEVHKLQVLYKKQKDIDYDLLVKHQKLEKEWESSKKMLLSWIKKLESEKQNLLKSMETLRGSDEYRDRELNECRSQVRILMWKQTYKTHL